VKEVGRKVDINHIINSNNIGGSVSEILEENIKSDFLKSRSKDCSIQKIPSK
jgi:hypothetical protein